MSQQTLELTPGVPGFPLAPVTHLAPPRHSAKRCCSAGRQPGWALCLLPTTQPQMVHTDASFLPTFSHETEPEGFCSPSLCSPLLLEGLGEPLTLCRGLLLLDWSWAPLDLRAPF